MKNKLGVLILLLPILVLALLPQPIAVSGVAIDYGMVYGVALYEGRQVPIAAGGPAAVRARWAYSPNPGYPYTVSIKNGAWSFRLTRGTYTISVEYYDMAFSYRVYVSPDRVTQIVTDFAYNIAYASNGVGAKV